MKLALLNTAIVTAEGTYKLKEISLQEAQGLIKDNKGNLDSAIGHQSTADMMSMLLDVDVEVNRQFFKNQVGQTALIFKLKGRPEEGQILDIQDIAKIGYKFQLLVREV